MDPAALLQGRTRETTIARDAEGRWSQDGIALSHPNLARSFDNWVARAEDGRYCLKNDINWAYVTIEGAPVFVRAVSVQSGVPQLVLSTGNVEPLNGETLRLGAKDGALYCDVSGSLTARFDRTAQTHLESLLGEDEEGVYVAWSGRKYRPAVVDEPIR